MNFRQRMLSAISVLIVSGFFISAISSFKIAQQQAFTSLIQQEMPLTLDSVYSDIQRDLLQPQLVSSLMANDTFLHLWVETEGQDIEDLAHYLSNIKDKYGLFSAFFVSERSKRYFYAGGLLKTVTEQNPVDNWYFRFVNGSAESELNIDPDMSNANQLAIFINVKVRNKENKLVGVVGVGLNIDNVEAQFDGYYQKYAKKVYFLNTKGDLLLSGSDAEKGQNIYNKSGIKEFASEILSSKEGTFAYLHQGKKYLLITRYVEALDLLLCVEAESGKIAQALVKPLIINIVISLLLLCIVLYLIFKTIARYHNKLEKIAWQDHLTGLSNRNYFSLQYKKEEARCRRQGAEMVFCMIDIDFFKAINDSQGHLQGDRVLKQFATLLQEILRPTDIIARWGGEEFIVLLPETNLLAAVKIAERLRVLVQDNILLQELTAAQLTVSIGLSSFDAAQSLDWHILMADKQLYQAKEKGRNCVAY